MTVGAYYRVFVRDWKTLRLEAEDISRRATMSLEKDTEISSNEAALKIGCQIFALSTFIVIPLLMNIGYITLIPKLNGLQVACLQLSLLAFNAWVRLVLPCVIPYLFGEKFGVRSYNFISVIILASMLSFIDILVPFVATLFQSDLCINQLLPRGRADETSIVYSYDECLLYYPSNGECAQSQQIVNNLSFQPPFVYSGQCRNAVIKIYLPLVIFSCAFNTFVTPLIYFVYSFKFDNLSEKIRIFGFEIEAREFVLPDLMYMITLVWNELLLLLTYGIVSPYAAFAIGCSTCSQIFVVCACICRYQHLQFRDVEDKQSVERNNVHIENICKACQTHIPSMLWPGIIMSSFLFSLYLFDMAYDVDDPTLGAPLAVAVLTNAIYPCVMLSSYRYEKIVQMRVNSRLSEMSMDRQSDQVELNTIENPIVVASQS